MEFSTLYRTKTLDQFSEADIDSTVKVAGWVENIRDHGGCLLYTSPSPRDP